MSDDIVTRLRERAERSLHTGSDVPVSLMREAADEVERLLTHMDALLLDNIELMAKVAGLQAIIDGRFESTSTTHEVRGD